MSAGRRREGEADPRERWRRLVSSLHTWKRGGVRAVHKPLLTLLLIARAERAGSSRVSFDEVDSVLGSLLRDFGPPRKSYHPEYPFWHLQSDGFWVMEDAGSYALRKSGSNPSRRTLLERGAAAAVPGPLWSVLAGDAALRAELASAILDEFWPASYHAEIRRAVGLPGERRLVSRRVRDPAFREAVLRAYARRCAVCGYDGRLGREDLALEAAHVRWHCYGGPDELANGLSLCSFHHVALDRGALGVDERHRILVSADVHGTAMVDTLLLRHAGQVLRAPQPGFERPALAHLRWHSREVFRAPPRGAA